MKIREIFNLKILAFSIAITFANHPAYAENSAVIDDYTFMDAIKTGKNLTSFRLRYEHVEQDGLQPATLPNGTTNPTAAKNIKDADGMTLRSLVGWQTAPYKNFSFGVQLINVSKLTDHFNDGTNSTLINGASNQTRRIEYAKIVDPDFTDINQLYVDWTGIKNTRVRLGRQQVNLDNVRFVGDIAFRQIMQVFDGVSVLNKSLPETEIFYAHFEEATQITSVQRGGDLDLLNVKYRISPTESLVGYGYFSNINNLGFGNAWFGAGTLNNNGKPNLDADQSNKTLGVRLDGTHPLNPNFRVHYTAEYAKQDDYADGDKRIDAHYSRLGGGAGYDNFNLRIDHEILSSNHSQYAFQTPYGTNHLFQGWVDKFLATPRQGIKDTFVTATYKWDNVLFFADYHIIKSDDDFYTVGSGNNANGNKYGSEWNVAATWNVDKHWMAKVEYGKFTEDDHYAAAANTINNAAGIRGRIHDTEKLWLTGMYTF